VSQIDWGNSGFAALAIADNIMKRLQMRGIITQADREAILDGAIQDISIPGNEALLQTADGIRSMFNRP
jgi:hypothetical protein